MNLPKDVITIAALGTAHSASKLESLSNIDTRFPTANESISPEHRLLKLVAHLSLHERAGRLPLIDLCSLPVPHTYHRLKPCTHQIHRFFQHILMNRALRDVLPECTRATVEAGFRPPEEFLPIIIKSFERQFRRIIYSPTWLGERAVWLTKLKNLDPATAIPLRIRYLRHHDPVLARKMIADEWATTDQQSRLEILDAMHECLSEADESFVESVLDHPYVTRQEQHLVRDLLVRIPASRFNQVVIANASQYATYDDEFNRIFIAFPRENDPALTRYGIFRPELTMANVSHRVIRFVPPSFWQELWGISAQGLLEAAENSFEKPLIWASIVHGTIHHRDTLFAGQLFEKVYGVINTELCRKLAAVLSPVEREIHLIKMVENYPFIHDKKHQVRGLLYQLEPPWSIAVSQQLIEKLMRSIRAMTFPYGPVFMFLTDFAAKMPVELCFEFLETLKGINISSVKWNELLVEIQDFLDFRAIMFDMLRREQKARVR